VIVMNDSDLKITVVIAGMVSGLHDQLWKLRDGQSKADARDIDNAQVYLEAVHWKLLQILERSGQN